jgi:hypothetical protein
MAVRTEAGMSQRNGDRARFQINRKRKLRHRQRVRALLTAVSERQKDSAGTEQHGQGAKPRVADGLDLMIATPSFKS